MKLGKSISSTIFYYCFFKSSIPALSQQKTFYNCFNEALIYELGSHQELISKDTAIENLLHLYSDSLLIKMNETVVESDLPLSKALPESTLGNWIADAARSTLSVRKRIDACIINYGSIGKDYIAPGFLTRKDFYELVPFENKLVIISVSGSLLHTICDSIAAIKGMPISGISFTIDSGKAKKILINNQPVNEFLMYTILVNDYLLNSRILGPLIGKLNYQYTGITLRKALLLRAETMINKGEHIHQL